MAGLRAFLAVDLAPKIHAALVRLKCELAARAPKVRWVHDEGLHATIKFLGTIAPAQLDAVRRILTPLVSEVVPFTAAVRGLGVFPSLKRPRVVWVGLHSDGLARLAELVQQGIEPLGFAPEARPFRAHITLGRIDAPQAWARLLDALQAHWSDDFGTCQIGELCAYRSELRPGGAVYSQLWTITFENNGGGISHGARSQS